MINNNYNKQENKQESEKKEAYNLNHTETLGREIPKDILFEYN